MYILYTRALDPNEANNDFMSRIIRRETERCLSLRDGIGIRQLRRTHQEGLDYRRISSNCHQLASGRINNCLGYDGSSRTGTM